MLLIEIGVCMCCDIIFVNVPSTASNGIDQKQAHRRLPDQTKYAPSLNLVVPELLAQSLTVPYEALLICA